MTREDINDVELARMETDMARMDAQLAKDTVDDAVQACVGGYNDHLQQAEMMQKINPILYDEGGAYWIWAKTSGCYIRADSTDILNGLRIHTGDRSTIGMKEKSEIMEAIR